MATRVLHGLTLLLLSLSVPSLAAQWQILLEDSSLVAIFGSNKNWKLTQVPPSVNSRDNTSASNLVIGLVLLIHSKADARFLQIYHSATAASQSWPGVENGKEPGAHPCPADTSQQNSATETELWITLNPSICISPLLLYSLFIAISIYS